MPKHKPNVSSLKANPSNPILYSQSHHPIPSSSYPKQPIPPLS